MTKPLIFMALGVSVSLFSLILIYTITSYAIIENNDSTFFFLIMPLLILIIGLLIFRHGFRLKRNA